SGLHGATPLQGTPGFQRPDDFRAPVGLRRSAGGHGGTGRVRGSDGLGGAADVRCAADVGRLGGDPRSPASRRGTAGGALARGAHGGTHVGDMGHRRNVRIGARRRDKPTRQPARGDDLLKPRDAGDEVGRQPGAAWQAAWPRLAPGSLRPWWAGLALLASGADRSRRPLQPALALVAALAGQAAFASLAPRPLWTLRTWGADHARLALQPRLALLAASSNGAWRALQATLALRAAFAGQAALALLTPETLRAWRPG